MTRAWFNLMGGAYLIGYAAAIAFFGYRPSWWTLPLLSALLGVEMLFRALSRLLPRALLWLLGVEVRTDPPCVVLRRWPSTTRAGRRFIFSATRRALRVGAWR